MSTLYCGKFTYEVTPEVQKVLEGVMYWTHCEKLDSQELQGAEKHIRKCEKEGKTPKYTEEEINNLRHDVEEARTTLRDLMQKMDQLDVPNWVGNGAMHWAETHDLRNHYLSDFFDKSKYAKPVEKELTER